MFTAETAKQEVIFCSAVTDAVMHGPPSESHRALQDFSDDAAIFVRYLEMQRDDMERCGINDGATTLQHCIDDLTAAKNLTTTTEPQA